MRLTQADAGFLYGELANGPMQTASITLLKGDLSFEKFREHMRARLHLVPPFRRKLAWVPMNLGHPMWVDDPDFDLDWHLVHVPMKAGSSVVDGVDEAVRLNEGLMDRSRPLWRFFLLTGIEGHTVLLQQIHHALIDGASSVHLSSVLYDFQPDAEAPAQPKQAWEPEPAPSAAEMTATALREAVESFVNATPFSPPTQDEARQRLMQRGVETMSSFVTSPAITAPWNAGVLGTRRRLRWFTRPFSELREVRRALGGTINDVALTAVTEGAARYLVDAGEPASDGNFRLMCPVNVRTEDEAGALGNRVSAMFPLIPAKAMDPVERLAAISAHMSELKETQQAQALTLMQESSTSMPPVALAPLQLIGTPFDPTALSAANPPPPVPRMGFRPPFFGVNFTVTNVPGFQVTQYCAGHEVLEVTGAMMIGGNLGLGVAVGSINQNMIFSFTGEPRLLPNLEGMVEHAEAAFDELLAYARGKLAGDQPPTSQKPTANRTGTHS